MAASKKSVVASQTVAIRMANAFDGSKAVVVNDWRKPAVESTSKRTLAVASVMGIGAALGVWLS